jgi:NADP-dependent 3-hydroxy acid dehydrogenase YdfG
MSLVRTTFSTFLRTVFRTIPAVNNAGYVLGAERVGQISSTDMEGMFNTNVFGLINMTQTFINGAPPRRLVG